jgi:hypothetical protein
MRIEGPIKNHELRETFANKLQSRYYHGGLFGPRHFNSTGGRMI